MVFEMVKEFRKDYKYTLGEKLKNEAITLVVNVYRANRRNSKSEILEAARENIEVVRLLVRIGSDLKLVSIKKLIRINEQIENISKQLSGWHLAEQKKSGTSESQRVEGQGP